ncbi:hypothetical protein [Kitasatospora sp. HPMI-4]|uniref:hypothetical protein n=1 Tax=Kitasatospora sp. HPMI-4 TaxID=3448443 RepID=UPI003F1A59B9
MTRPAVRSAALSAAALLAAGAPLAVAAPAGAATPPSGSAVVTESGTFFQQAAAAGIVAVPLPPAGASYDATKGPAATFRVTGGSASLPGYYGTVQLGGGLLAFDARTGKCVTFEQLAFDAGSWQLTGVPAGGTAPVALLDPAGSNTVTRNGATQNLAASDLRLDAAGAALLDSRLGTSFFTAGQSVGSFSLSFTPGS